MQKFCHFASKNIYKWPNDINVVRQERFWQLEQLKNMVLVNKYVGLISLQYYQTIIAYIIDTMPIATVSNIAQ